MKFVTFVIIPEGKNGASKQFALPAFVVRFASILLVLGSAAMGFLVFDYIELIKYRSEHQRLVNETEGLKGEARALMNNLEEVKTSLSRVQDYTSKLQEITQVRVKEVKKQTGIDANTNSTANTQNLNKEAATSSMAGRGKDFVPLGLNLDRLTFRPIFDELTSLGSFASYQLLDMQRILSMLSQQRSLLNSVPSITPVDGWITSGYGWRVSPFTGERSLHQGLDVAGPIGTPILAPADGIVIFTGSKSGFGNFIMIAHGYGIVSRYGHNDDIMVQLGQRVLRGEQIGTVGNSGRSTGPHLHYEVVVNGQNVNPQKFILDMDKTLTAH